jgi:transcription factor C subunit 6
VLVGTGAWSSQIGVHRVVWNDKNGLESAGVLASGTSAGIVRIDNLEGRWFCDRVPYGSVDAIRGEGSKGSGDDEEEEEDDEESEDDRMNVD